jgi:hypothetical protein
MNPSELVAMMFSRGVWLFVRGGTLHYRAGSGSYTGELKQLVDENRPELTAWLSAGTAERRCICGCTEGEYHAIHGGRSVRPDCAKCWRFICFSIWGGEVREE